MCWNSQDNCLQEMHPQQTGSAELVRMIHRCVVGGFRQTSKLSFANKALLHHHKQGAFNPNFQILRVSVCMLSL